MVVKVKLSTAPPPGSGVTISASSYRAQPLSGERTGAEIIQALDAAEKSIFRVDTFQSRTLVRGASLGTFTWAHPGHLDKKIPSHPQSRPTMKLSVISLMFAIVLGAQSGKTPTHIHHMPPLTRPPPPTHHPPPTQLPISVLLEILGGAFLAQPYSNAGAGKHPRPPVYEFSLLQQAVVGPAAPRLRTLVGSISERFAASRPLALVSRRGALRMQVTTA